MSEIIRNARKMPKSVQRRALNYGVGRRIDPKTKDVLPVLIDDVVYRHGASPAAVTEAAERHLVRLNDALESYNATRSEVLASGASPAEAEYAAAKQLDDIAEVVRRAAKEAGPDGRGAVVADVARALATFGEKKPAALSMVLRRAGNPELFANVAGSLDKMPQARVSVSKQGTLGVIADKKAVAQPRRDEGPVAYRPSSVFGTAKVSGGKVVNDSKAFKKNYPKDSDPSKGDLARVIEDEETGELRIYDPKTDAHRYSESRPAAGSLADSTRAVRLNDMAGDQIAEVRAIEKKGMAPQLSKVIVKRNSGEAPVSEATLKTGSRLSDSDQWSAKDRTPIYRKVEARNRGAYENLHNAIDHAHKTGGTVNFDLVAPWVRSRFPVLDAKGNVIYPKQMVSAEWLTGFMQNAFRYAPDFGETYIDTIRRSLDALPATPTTDAAARASKRVFYPSDEFVKVMKQGVGTPDYPHAIYGPRKIPADDVSPPTPAKVHPKVLEALENLRNSRSARPGKTDQSSIYTMPGALGALLA